MAFDVAEIRDGIKTRLQTITGLRCYDTVPSDTQMNFPAAVVSPDDPFISPNETFGGGMVEIRFKVDLYVSLASTRTGQDRLDDYCSAGTGEPRSIVDAIEGDETLSGEVHATTVESVDGYGFAQIDGSRVAGTVTFHLVCLAERS